MRKRGLLFTLSACLLPLAGCFASDGGDTLSTGDCNILGADDLQLWIDAMPGPGSPRMIINFTATTPTPGYAVEGKVATIKERMPPIYVIDLTTTPPDGIVAQVVTKSEVKLAIPIAYDTTSSVEILCDGKILFEVDEVPITY